MTVESDDLLRHIYSFVHGRVRPDLEDIVIELVGRTVVTVMTNPEFYSHLTYVQELQREIWNLRQALISYQQADVVRAQRANARRMSAAKKAAPRKVAAPRKAAPKKAAPSNVRAFKRGLQGR